jgi:hypothetical protein
VKLWLSTQPNPVEQFKRLSYEEMKEALMKHLNPEEELKEQADPIASKQPETSAFTLSTSKASIDSSIDDLFNI